MFKRKGQHQEIVKNVKITRANRVVVKNSGFVPKVGRRHPFSNGNRS